MDEEIARAEVYGLLAQLYYAPAAPQLLASLRAAVTEAPAAGGFLQGPWCEFVGVARAMGDQAVVSEYDALFAGVGKPEVYLFGSHYLSGFLNEKPLARLRADLAALGLARDEAMPETEDHIAYLCEVMRYLIAGDGHPEGQGRVGGHDTVGDAVAVANLARQGEFFAAHVQPWVVSLCDTIVAHPKARFYAALAGFTRAFAGVEAQAFDMLD